MVVISLKILESGAWGGQVKVIAFLTDYAVVDHIIAHLRKTFVAERHPPHHAVSQEFLMDSETEADYFS